MGLEAATLAYIAIGTGVVSAGLSYQQGQQQAKQQKKAAAAQRRAEEIKAAKARKDAVREASIKRAQIIANTSASGTQETSGAMGGISSIGSTLAGNIQTADALQEQYGIASVAGAKASQANANAGAFGDISGLAFSFGVSQMGVGASTPQPVETFQPVSNNVGTWNSSVPGWR